MSASTPTHTAAVNPRPAGRGALVPLALALVLLGFLLVPPVRGHARLELAFAGASGLLALGCALVAWRARRRGEPLRIELVPGRKSHYIQGCVQLCIYAYWGWYWRDVYREAPLILAQLVFLYAFEALLSFARGQSWRLGFGPLPIVLSTNVFLWFVHDWYALQFVTLAIAALGKQLVQWERDGKRTHVFNPSAFCLALVSLVLIATGTTQLTRGIEIATTIGRPPHIYLEIFLLGLVVQFFFATTLMTLAAAATLLLWNVVWERATGTWFFVDTNLPIAIFLGLHLLVTDPSTSPRSSAGRVIFGALYGAGNILLYALLQHWGVPEFYDKLLPVPLLNLGVQWMDRMARRGWLARLGQIEARLRPHLANGVHMALWSAVFVTLLATGYVEAAHPGRSLAFWKQAAEEGRSGARERYLKLVGAQAEAGSGEANRLLGEVWMEGRLRTRDRALAAYYLARASALGDLQGARELAVQFLFLREARSDADVLRALERLEAQMDHDGRSAYLLGFACETGRGRELDAGRAAALYALGSALDDPDCRRAAKRLRAGGAPTGADVLPEWCSWVRAIATGAP